jgi:hypothetical protein
LDLAFVEQAYSNKAFQIGAGQTISHPITVAFQTQLLEVKRGDKILEIGIYKYAWDLFEISLDLRWRGSDHAGPSFEINVLGYTARIGISDKRHWNSETNSWCNYDKEDIL